MSTSTGKSWLLRPTSDSAPLWQGSTNIRSTFDLISSCVLTLLICVWTAIHLNIPRYKERRRGGFAVPLWRRIWWMFMGLIGPELVLYTAWSQFIQARLVTMRLRKIDNAREFEKRGPEAEKQPQHDDHDVDDDYYNDLELAYKSSRSRLLPHDPTMPPKLSWYTRLRNLINPEELERGYYAAMGGFEVVIGKEEKRGDIRDIRRTVTPCGTVLLARLGLLPSLSIEGINDKSKADMLTKTLVCIQACWMLVQAFARKVERLPITLLELNTIMHVVCALMMYLLWLKKPQDVGIPTIIYDRHKRKPLGTLLSIKEVKQEKPDMSPALGHILRWKNGVFEHKAEYSDTWFQNWHGPQSLSTAPMVPGVKKDLDLQAAGKLQARQFWISNSDTTGTYISFSDKTFLTYEKAQFLVDYSSGKIPTFGKSKSSWKDFCEEIQHNGGVGCAKKASNFVLEGSIKSEGSEYAGWVATFIFPAIYGGVHLTPWKAHFPTYLERYLWRFSGLCVACGVPTLLLLFGITESTWETSNPFKMPFLAFKWVMSFRPKDGSSVRYCFSTHSWQ
ncbi:hypothetical protein L211DRAFT_840815 [Terfezia boudieri ATCC MYA-4762]|uniref:Uncharacterized protein n=1 Tax=Terfezia boudieri ATCC MYA-4762 TaxID=1051890 RepID=A0A3N4LL55_9PEZI|nr:hypothetical protein L211DRAFT_840815 [Terfezia boudieri ATCC MYA-4762]